MRAIRSPAGFTSVLKTVSTRRLALSRLFIPKISPTFALRMQSSISSTSPAGTSTVASSAHNTAPTEIETPIQPPKAKKPSPYRLLTPEQRAEFLPTLESQGWSVQPLGTTTSSSTLSSVNTSSSQPHPDQQQQELVGSFQFTHSKGKVAAQAAWRATLRFVAAVGEIIEAEDHHPTLTITPSGCGLGFVVQIQTHTHAPLPSVPGGDKPPPNLTRKDISLACLISKAYEPERDQAHV